MKLPSLALLLASAILGACVTADSLQEVESSTSVLDCAAASPDLADLELVEVDGVVIAEAPSGAPDTITPPGEVLAEAPSACDCATAACIVDYIEDHFGCGLCAHIVCGDTVVGGCVACPENGTDAAVDASCVITPPAEHGR